MRCERTRASRHEDVCSKAEKHSVAWRYEDPEQDKQKIAWRKRRDECRNCLQCDEVEYGGNAKAAMWGNLIFSWRRPCGGLSGRSSPSVVFSECSRRRQRNQM
jgi:hypothetical protein